MSTAIYSQLFDQIERNDSVFFLNLFTSPVNHVALASIFRVNSKSTGSHQQDVYKTNIFKQVLEFGIELFDKGSFSRAYKVHQMNSKRDAFQRRLISSDGDESDITTCMAGEKIDNCITVEILDEDITEHPRNAWAKIPTSFGKLDDDLRSQLLSNTIKILEVWTEVLMDVETQNIMDENKGSNNCMVNLLEENYREETFSMFRNLAKFITEELLTLNSYIQQDRIEFDPIILANLVNFLSRLLKFCFFKFSFNFGKKDDLGFISLFNIKALPNALCSMLSTKVISWFSYFWENKTSERGRSFQFFGNLYFMLGTLSNLPNVYFLERKNASPGIPSPKLVTENVFEQYVSKSLKYDDEFYFFIERNLCALLCLHFNFLYSFMPDLLMNQIHNSSFFNWLTASRFHSNFYPRYKSIETISSYEVNFKELSAAKIHNDSFLLDLNTVLDYRIKKRKGDFEQNDFLEMDELIPFGLFLFSSVKNISFLRRFTSQKNKISYKIEDLELESDRSVELLDIWLCVLSYTFCYNHAMHKLQKFNSISLLTILDLLSDDLLVFEGTSFKPIMNLGTYVINEFKWKICHHKTPLVATGVSNNGLKPSLFYLLDSVQCFVRFNMTRNIDIGGFKLCNMIIRRILCFLKDTQILDENLGDYSWLGFYETLINFVLFYEKKNLEDSKLAKDSRNLFLIRSILEEFMLNVDILLSSKFNDVKTQRFKESQNASKSMNHDLIYLLLLNFNSIKNIIDMHKFTEANMKNLHSCMIFLKSNILSHEKIIDSSECNFESDIPEISSLLESYYKGAKNKTTENEGHFRYADTYSIKFLEQFRKTKIAEFACIR